MILYLFAMSGTDSFTRAVMSYKLAPMGDNPRLKALGLVQQFYWTADFMKMQFGGYVIGEGNRPGDVLHDMEAMIQARALNRQVASLLG